LDSNNGFNIAKNRSRRAIREERRSIRLSTSASQSSLPPGDFQSSADPSPSVDDTPLAAEEDLLAPIASGGMPAGKKVDCSQHEEDDYSKLGEDIQREDSDFERHVLTRAIQRGLDSNSEAVHELLSHGRPVFEVGSGSVEEEGEEVEVSRDGFYSEWRASSAPPEGQQEQEQENLDEPCEQDDEDVEMDPPPRYELNYNKGSRYEAYSFDMGTQTAVDRLTRYRTIGETAWLPVPMDWRVPRLEDPLQEQEAALHEERCFVAGIHPDEHFGAVLTSQRAKEESAMRAETARKEEAARKDEVARKAVAVRFAEFREE